MKAWLICFTMGNEEPGLAVLPVQRRLRPRRSDDDDDAVLKIIHRVDARSTRVVFLCHS